MADLFIQCDNNRKLLCHRELKTSRAFSPQRIHLSVAPFMSLPSIGLFYIISLCPPQNITPRGLSFINLALRSTPWRGWMEKHASWVSLCPGPWLGSQSPWTKRIDLEAFGYCCAQFCLHAHQAPSLSNVTQFPRHQGDGFLLLERCSFHPLNLTLI